MLLFGLGCVVFFFCVEVWWIDMGVDIVEWIDVDYFVLFCLLYMWKVGVYCLDVGYDWYVEVVGEFFVGFVF